MEQGNKNLLVDRGILLALLAAAKACDLVTLLVDDGVSIDEESRKLQ